MKVLIVDDYTFVRIGLALLVKQIDRDAEILEAEELDGGLEAARTPDLDLILVEPRISGMESLERLTDLRDAAAGAAILVLANCVQQDDALRAITLGANGYMDKGASETELLLALRWVLSGQIYMPAGLHPRKPAADAEPAPMPKTTRGLTRRQCQVLAEVAQGKTNAQIARDLGIKLSTTRLHVSALMSRLGASNRTEAALIYLEAENEEIDVARRLAAATGFEGRRRAIGGVADHR